MTESTGWPDESASVIDVFEDPTAAGVWRWRRTLHGEIVAMSDSFDNPEQAQADADTQWPVGE